jgi:hypothetical protein
VEVERTGEDVDAEGVRVVAVLWASTLIPSPGGRVGNGEQTDRSPYRGWRDKQPAACRVHVQNCRDLVAVRSVPVSRSYGMSLVQPVKLKLSCCFFRLHFGLGSCGLSSASRAELCESSGISHWGASWRGRTVLAG